MNLKFKTIAACTLLLSACGGQQPKEEAKNKPDVLAANADTTISPGEDFFAFANGTWIKNNPIPADETGWGIGWVVDKELREKLFAINADAVKKGDKSGSGQLIGDFWYSAMDTLAIEKMGIEPLRSKLNEISAIKTRQDLLTTAAMLHTISASVFFSGYVAQDAKNSDVMAYYLSQGGLGLGNRDYYFSTNPRTEKIFAQYPAFITKLFTLIGNDEATAAKKAANVVAIETSLAKASRKLEDLRDPYKNYNKYAIKDLAKLAPGTDWPSMLAKLGVQNADSIIVGQPEFFKALDKVMTATDVEALKDYMTFTLVRTYAEYLSKPFADADFDFYDKTMMGAQQQQPWARRALDAEQSIIGEALGQLFVKEYFGETAKKRYEKIVENVRTAYKARIEKLDWMSAETKQKAIHKLMAITPKIGYPDKWKDFSALKIDRGPYALNIMRGATWLYNYEMNKLGKPVDRAEWSMTPQTYNAYYNESNNEIVLPAAMMSVPGYKDEELDDALVYGYMAASTVGHEITHGFDDQGRQYDEKGNLHNWWTDEDAKQFNKRADVLVQQFNKMTPVDTIHINGRATLGENLADLGGILIGLDAFKQTEAYKKNEKIGGFTPLQRFFLGYSLGWQLVQRPETIADNLLTDVHSPSKCRVNGPFPNVPEFYEAFNVKPGDKMYLADSLRVKLW